MTELKDRRGDDRQSNEKLTPEASNGDAR
jgi:hypothetical protein